MYLGHCERGPVLGGVGARTLKRYQAVRDKHLGFCEREKILQWTDMDKNATEKYGNWLTKRMQPRERDARNHAELALEAILERYAIGRLGKLITDAVFQAYKQSDRVIWVDSITKVQSSDEKVEVTILEHVQ